MPIGYRTLAVPGPSDRVHGLPPPPPHGMTDPLVVAVTPWMDGPSPSLVHGRIGIVTVRPRCLHPDEHAGEMGV
jgi:hypothetical protein